tara:strand:+ start:279 stop:824 length:546 start_codon:yes stop_codon:yes gene_type:complete
MSIYVPPMQQRFTGYDSGRNTARNLLDAVRMKNEKEAADRRLNIAETQAANMQKLFEQDQSTRAAVNKAIQGQIKTRQEQEDYKKRMAKSGTGASLPYRTAQWITDYLNPFTESREARIKRESGVPMDYRVKIDDFQDPNIDLQSIYPYMFGRENLLQQLMLQNPAYTQQLNLNPQTNTYE